MNTEIRIEFNHLPELRRRFPSEVRAIVRDATLRVEREAKRSMRGPKHGRTYRRAPLTKTFSAKGNTWREYAGAGMKAREVGGKMRVVTGYKFHRASAPGEAPAIDTGNLVNSITSMMLPDGTGLVMANSEYAAPLEYGTPHMAARPFFRPAAIYVRGWFIDALMNLERRLK